MWACRSPSRADLRKTPLRVKNSQPSPHNSARPYLAFVETLSDCENLESYSAQRKIFKADVFVIALAVDTEEWLREHLWRFASLERVSDFSSHVDQIWIKSITFGDNWFKHLPVENHYYEQVAIPDFRRFSMHALSCHIVIETVLPAYPNHCVLLLPADQSPISHYFGYLTKLSSNGVFKGMLRWYCRRHCIPAFELQGWTLLTNIKNRLSPWLAIFIKLIPAPKQIARFVLTRWIPTRKNRRSSNCEIETSFSASPKADVMIGNWGYDLERNMKFPDVTNHPGFSNVRMVHICHRDEACSNSMPLHHVIRVYGKGQAPIISLRREFLFRIFLKRWRSFQRCRKRLSMEYGEFLFNKELTFQFLHMFFEVYKQIYFHRCNVLALLKQFAPRVFITSDIDVVDARAHLLAAKEFGAITMTTNHGFYLYAPPASNFQGDYCLVGGPALKENLLKGGVPGKKILIIGNSSFSRSDAIVATAEKQVNIVIITAAPFDLWSSQYRPTDYVECIRSLVENLSSDIDRRVIIKSHPVSDMYSEYDTIVCKLNRSNLRHISKAWSRTEFCEATIAVCIGNLSGSTLELQSAGVPIVYVEGFAVNALRTDYKGCGVVVSGPGEACSAVRLLLNDASYFQSVADQGFRFLERYTNAPNNSVDTFCRVVRSFIEKNLTVTLELS